MRKRNGIANWLLKGMMMLVVAMSLSCAASAAELNVTVPASLPISVGENGDVTTATNAVIKNNGVSTVYVSSINLRAGDGWSIDGRTEVENAAAGEKKIAIAFNKSWATADGETATVDVSGFKSIGAGDSLSISYDAVIPAAKTPETDVTAATATFIIKGEAYIATMVPGETWYKSTSLDKTAITKISFSDSTEPASFDEVWKADSLNEGEIKCYRNGTELTIVGNGMGKIKANPDSSNMFSGFTALNSIENMGVLDTTSVTDMSSMFENCSSFTSLDLSTIGTSNAVNTNAMFKGCSGLTSLDVTVLNTANVSTMDEMFNGCSNLAELDFSDFSTESATSMTNMLSGCVRLKKLKLGAAFSFNGAMGQRLTSPDAPSASYIDGADGKWHTVSGKSYAPADIPNNTSDIYYASSTVLPASPTMAANETWFKGTSDDRTNLTKIVFTKEYTPTGNETVWNADEGDTGAIKCYLSGTELYVCSNGFDKIIANKDSSYMFSHNGGQALTSFKSLGEIDGLDMLDTSGVTNMAYMFAYTRSLRAIDVSSFDTSNVTNMEYMFSTNLAVTKLDLRNFNTSKVTNMNYMFHWLTDLTDLDVSSFDTSNVTSMNGMFESCTSITDMDLSSFDTRKVTNMENMFHTCQSVTYLDVSSFETPSLNNFNNTFDGCESLESLDLSGFDTSNITSTGLFSKKYSMNNTFNNCHKLSEVTLGSKFKFLNALAVSPSYLPSPSPLYIDGADGKWYNSKGVSYTNKTIPANTADTYYADSSLVLNGSIPMFAENYHWYKASADRKTITKITFTNKYEEPSSVDESWNADMRGKGKIKAYRVGTEIVVGRPDGGKMYTNNDAHNMFSYKGLLAFHCFKKLESIEGLENLDTSKTTNFSHMFYGAEVLTSLDLSTFNMQSAKNMSHMFDFCKILKTVSVGENFDTSNVTNMSYLLADCNNFADTSFINHLNTSNVTTMEEMFYNCNGFASLPLKNFNTAKVTDMSRMFMWCQNLKSLDLSCFDTSSVTTMRDMFRECKNLQTLNISGFNTSAVTTMEGMFSFCESLQVLDVSGFDTSSVTSMKNMFNFCTAIKSLDVSKFNTAAVTTMSDMFYNCESVTYLPISNFDTSSVTDMSDMFWGCGLLTSLDVSKFNTSKVTNMMSMFWGCDSLTSLDVSNFNTSNVTNMSNMFGCEKLLSLDVTAFDTSNVTSMNDMFNGCRSLTTIDVSKFKTDNVTDMGGMFGWCKKLQSLDLSNFNTSKVTNMMDMFVKCRALRSLNVSSFDTSNVKDMDGMFECCESLATIDIANFDTSKVTDMSMMFYRCTSITSLDLSSFDTASVTRMFAMFERDSSLSTIYVSNAWTVDAVTDSDKMFGDCYSLRGDRSYDSSVIDKTYATASGGYLTLKASTQSIKLNVDQSGTVNGYTEQRVA